MFQYFFLAGTLFFGWKLWCWGGKQPQLPPWETSSVTAALAETRRCADWCTNLYRAWVISCSVIHGFCFFSFGGVVGKQQHRKTKNISELLDWAVDLKSHWKLFFVFLVFSRFFVFGPNAWVFNVFCFQCFLLFFNFHFCQRFLRFASNFRLLVLSK